MGKWGNAFDILRDTVYGLAQHLDLYEQTTLHFIFRRTQYFGKDWEPIPLRQFLRGVWSKEYGCITPRIRISEKKLLEALKSLEAKGIIQVVRAVTKSNRYRIVKVSEVSVGKIAVWNFENKPALSRDLLKQLEHNVDILDKEHLAMLLCLDEGLAELKCQRGGTGDVTTASPVMVRVPARIGEHKLPISSKKPMKVIPRRSATHHAFSQSSGKNNVGEETKRTALRILPRPIPRDRKIV